MVNITLILILNFSVDDYHDNVPFKMFNFNYIGPSWAIFFFLNLSPVHVWSSQNTSIPGSYTSVP